MFSDAFSRDHQLIQADPKHSLYLACALLVRGNVQVSDLRRNIERFVIPHRVVMEFVQRLAVVQSIPAFHLNGFNTKSVYSNFLFLILEGKKTLITYVMSEKKLFLDFQIKGGTTPVFLKIAKKKQSPPFQGSPNSKRCWSKEFCSRSLSLLNRGPFSFHGYFHIGRK